MVSLKRNITSYLQENNLFSGFQILNKKSGLSNDNYIIESEGQKYIVRLNKQKPTNYINILEKEHHLLKFLEKKKIDFVPKSIFYDSQKNVHIMKYIEGRLIRFRCLSKAQMEQAVLKLHQINILADEYKKYCIAMGIKPLEPQSEIESIKSRIEAKLTLYKRGSGFSHVVRWIREHLKKDFENYKPNKKNIFLNHGDPADNLIVKGKNIYIIDWEYVKSSYGPGAVHIIAHGRLDREREEELLRMYAKISCLDYAELCQKTYTEKMAYYLLKLSKLIIQDVGENLGLEEKKKNAKNLQELYLKTRKKTKACK